MAIEGASRLAKNSVVIFIARFIETASSIVVVALLTRYLHVTLFGEYAWIQAIVLFFQPLINFELNTILTREIAKNPQDAERYVSSALLIKWTLLLVFFVAIGIFSMVGSLPTNLKIALILAVLTEFFTQHSLIFTGVFTAFERMEYEMLLTLAFRILSLAGYVACVVWDLGFAALFAVPLLAGSLRFLLGLYVVQYKFLPLKVHYVPRVIRFLLSEAFLVTIGSFLTSLSFRVDIYILKWLRTATEVSLFHLPHTIILQLQIIPAALVTALFPFLSRWGDRDDSVIKRAWITANKILITIGGLIAIVVTVLAAQIIVLLGGESFLPAKTSLIILVWCGIILFLNFLCTYLLIALKLQRKLIIGAAVSVAINIGLDLLLVPSMGHIGAAIGTLAAYFSQICIVIFFLGRRLQWDRYVVRSLTSPLLATICATAIGALLARISPAIGCAGGILGFIAALLLLKIYTRDEAALLKQTLQAIASRLARRPA